ncbi:hypothetical protein AOLI_G00260410 [Acnodon oligacanthus]
MFAACGLLPKSVSTLPPSHYCNVNSSRARATGLIPLGSDILPRRMQVGKVNVRRTQQADERARHRGSAGPPLSLRLCHTQH